MKHAELTVLLGLNAAQRWDMDSRQWKGALAAEIRDEINEQDYDPCGHQWTTLDVSVTLRVMRHGNPYRRRGPLVERDEHKPAHWLMTDAGAGMLAA